jgi:type IV secretory pathway VirB4 component
LFSILKKKKPEEIVLPNTLSKKEQKQIKELIKKAKKDDGIPRTAQQSIPYQRMFPDGICRVRDSYYTKTVQFQDINYQLAQKEDKTAIFEEWCSFLNFFDSSVHFEISFMNMSTDAEDFEKNVRIPLQKDEFNPVRNEYSQMLKSQLAQGNNGLTKTKYLTFGIEAESMRQAKPRLEHIQTDLLNNFRRLGVAAKLLNGKERLQLMHSIFHMGDLEKFQFDWNWLAPSGLSTKDFIAPTSFSFHGNRIFQIGELYGAMSYLFITAPELSDQLLKDFLDMESSQIVTMHIQSVDQTSAIKKVKRTITELDRSKIEEQKKAVRSGYDMDIIPSDLATYGKDAKKLLTELQSQNERMFLVTFLVMNTGKTKQELENNVFQASSIAQKHSCNLRRLDYQQENALMSSLPLANNLIEIERALTTSSTAIFVPFTTQELFQNGKEALYYGLNALSNNLIMVDRKKLKNPNGLILGTPGSGKSFSAKREIANAFLVTDDDIIVCDPEAEYSALVHKFKGQVVKISPSSTHFINPMDINANYSEEDNPVALKADFILSLCELIVGGKDGLQPIEKTVIDRCVHHIYQKYFENPVPENMPLLEDLYNALLEQEEKEAHHVATALEIYVKGSLNLFNHRTNIDINNRLVCYDIKELGKQLKKIGMLVVQDQVWGRVTANRNAGKATRYYMDEFHLLLKEEQTAAYSVEIWKRFRKWGGIPTGITQNVKDLLSSREVENIFENSDFIYMLNQASGDRQILASQLNISPHQLSYVTHSGEGEGLLFYGNVILPFVDRFPTDLELYRIMTTKLSEVSADEEKDNKA